MTLRASRFLSGVLWFIHLGGMLLVGIAVPAWTLRAGLWVFLALSLYQSLRLHGRRTATRAITDLEMDREGTVSVKFAGAAEWCTCRLINRFVHPRMVALTLRTDARRRPVQLVLVSDAVEADAFRRLRARLKRQNAAA